MNFWIAAQKTYSTATDKFDRAVSTRAFSLFFFALSGLVAVVGLAINFGVSLSPVLLMALISVATVFWVFCFALQDNRHTIQEWIRNKLLVYSVPITTLPNLDATYRSVTPSSEDIPPRSTPRAKS